MLFVMSELPELTLDEIISYCFFRGMADVAFNKDRDSGILLLGMSSLLLNHVGRGSICGFFITRLVLNL
jgi:hypothetical protein